MPKGCTYIAHSESSPSQELYEGAADDKKAADELQGKAYGPLRLAWGFLFGFSCFCLRLKLFIFFLTTPT